ncbi:DUF6236 family protein [Glycomyces sp. TRM65418]|uniref:DUF6236 family protein n=1 Tax=Glycomyces sp. TRM65418 TaxID=2867006 RepID=UPI001CE6523D|nr:DUF6236 family protein [Glycomyces sp. TRM65418]MCC3762243.1 DUF6236 family protein [Glycomyces sp. TRM65418]QZD56302.1 hypothetical protein K3N28_04020 [Glycomyces sp. TRM65418]
MVTPIGLYYPYTHFHDRGWLKVAALYWPRMARIAPLGYADVDNPDARALREQLDFVLDLDPGQEVCLDVGLKVIDALYQYGDLIRERYRIPEQVVRYVGGASSAGERRVEYRFPELGESVRMEHPTRRWPQPVRFPAPSSFHRLIALHERKVHETLVRELTEHRLAVLDDNGRYAAVHPNFAWAYMCMLAEEMAGAFHLTPVADDPSAYAECGSWTAERFASALLGEEVEEDGQAVVSRSRLGMLALRIAVPADPESVPVEKIVKIRRRYGAELAAYHELIAELAAELSTELEGIRGPGVLEAYLAEEVSRKVEQPLADLRRAMRGLGVDTALGAASIKFEFPAAAALAAGWAAGQPVIAAAGAAFGLGAWYRTWRTSRSAHIRSSPVGYLWRVERDLKGTDLLRRSMPDA